MIPLHGVAFFGFNALRLLSIAATLLVFTTTLIVMVEDGREYNAARGDPEDDFSDCEYFPGTDVPTHVWGIFWVQLDRAFILILLLLCVLSEINWGGKLQKAFDYCLPVLGRNFGTGPLGALQMMVSTNLLSHYLEDFPLVTAWLLAIVGLLNFHFGLIFRQRQRDYRSMSPTRRAVARGEAKPIVSGTSQFKPTLKGSALHGDVEKSGFPPFVPPPDIAAINKLEAFQQAQQHQQQEELRMRARQENARVEVLDGMRHGIHGNDTGSIISGAFLYDSSKDQPVALGCPHSGLENRFNGAFRSEKSALSRQPSVSQWSLASRPNNAPSLATTVWPQPTGRSALSRQGTYNGAQPHVAAQAGRPRTPASYTSSVYHHRNAIKRKSLALAKAARKRLSTHASARTKASRKAETRGVTPLWTEKSSKTYASHFGMNMPANFNRETEQQVARERDRLESLAREMQLSGSRHGYSHEDHRHPSPAYEAVPSRHLQAPPMPSNPLDPDHDGYQFLPEYQAATVLPLAPLGNDTLPIAGRYQSEWAAESVAQERDRSGKPWYKL